MAYAILRFEKIKTSAGINSINKHNDRSRSTPNANLEIQNLTLHGDVNKSYLESFNEITKNMNIRKNAVLGIECFMSASPEANFLEDKTQVKKWAIESIDWLKKEFGTDNIIKSQLHLDESTPHLHTFIIPTKDKKLNCKHFLGTRDKLRKLQTNYYKVVSKYDLERGLEGSKSTHLDIKKFYTLLNEAIKKELPKEKIFESAKNYKQRIKEEYTKLYVKNINLELKIEKLQKNILQRPSIMNELRESEEFFKIKDFLKRHPEVKQKLNNLIKQEETKNKSNKINKNKDFSR